jgi:hypothetical protein
LSSWFCKGGDVEVIDSWRYSVTPHLLVVAIAISLSALVFYCLFFFVLLVL